jgi:hypothetical protein
MSMPDQPNAAEMARISARVDTCPDNSIRVDSVMC